MASELLLAQYSSKLEIRIARFHNVYGPWGSWGDGREKAPAAFLRKAIAAKLLGESPTTFEIWGDGKQRRSFCYIDDAVDAVLRLVASDCAKPVNIGSDRAVTIQQLAETAIAAVGLEPATVEFKYDNSRPVGVGSRNSDNTFVKAALGWEPTRSLEDGLSLAGAWIEAQIEARTAPMSAPERTAYLQQLQKSDVVDLSTDAITFAILLPITSRGSAAPQDCLENLDRFARSLLRTTADDVARLGERYRFCVYLAIDEDDGFLWASEGGNAAERVLRECGVGDVETLPPCKHPRGHVCALWRDLARCAYGHRCDYYILMGDDVVIEDPNWMSTIHQTFGELASAEGVPRGVGCVAFTDTSFPGMPTFPAVHRTHMEIFEGEVIPDNFTNQDGDPFLFQLYRAWGCAKMVRSRLSNKMGGSEDARYKKVHAAGWTIEPLNKAISTVQRWFSQNAPAVQGKLTLDVVIPCYRVNMSYVDAFLALQPSQTCSVMFIIIVDDPLSPNIGELLQKYGHRVDVRIRINDRNLGASASRNRGLQESAAEWVHFLDDDVTPDADLLVEAEKAIRAHPTAAGFVGNAQFPSADTVATTAIHLAGVTYFWDIAEKIARDVPWGVTANIIARRNVPDGVAFDLRFPKTGGGEDIDYCRRKRAFARMHGGEGFVAAPRVRVTHPWWNAGRRSWWRFYMWSKGDGALVSLYPEHNYRDFSPNAAECLLLCALVFVLGSCAAVFDRALAFNATRFAVLAAVSVVLANIVHDILRHTVLHPERVKDMKTPVRGAQWTFAIVEGALIRMFSEWGRVVGLLERGDIMLLSHRFDWFCGVWGDGPMREERRNNQIRLAMSVAVFAILGKAVL